VIFPEYELTLPPSRGQLTTVEGLIRDIIADLTLDQPLRRIQDPSTFAKIESLLNSLRANVGAGDRDPEDEDPPESPPEEFHSQPFTIKLDDPAGNSFIQFIGDMADPKWKMTTYPRTRDQNVQLGLVSADMPFPNAETSVDEEDAADRAMNEEVYSFPCFCPGCGHPVATRMKKVVIPWFKVCYSYFRNKRPQWTSDAGDIDHGYHLR